MKIEAPSSKVTLSAADKVDAATFLKNSEPSIVTDQAKANTLADRFAQWLAAGRPVES